ncbi:MAG: hypothetical protein FWF76_01615 [Oscillospiraceae bacterium]|nr:hypothetical protein [Oscillospiraceae bacterium]
MKTKLRKISALLAAVAVAASATAVMTISTLAGPTVSVDSAANTITFSDVGINPNEARVTLLPADGDPAAAGGTIVVYFPNNLTINDITQIRITANMPEDPEIERGNFELIHGPWWNSDNVLRGEPSTGVYPISASSDFFCFGVTNFYPGAGVGATVQLLNAAGDVISISTTAADVLVATDSNGGDTTTAAGGEDTTTAAGDGDTTTAAGGGDTTTAAGGGDTTTTAAGGGDTTTAAGGGDTTTTAAGGGTNPPTGIVIALIPTVFAAGAIAVTAKKRK